MGVIGLRIYKTMIISIALLVLSIMLGCTTKYPNQKPIGEKFPEVTGQSLANKVVKFPEHVYGKNVVLLLGYIQNSQFDIDRWLIGLDMTKTQVEVFELPTIQGMLPRFFKTQIDEGMKKGIPKELWSGVVTIYQDGERMQAFTGNINSNNARVILLNKKGKIEYFYDEGFSVTALNSLRERLVNIDDISPISSER